jgi:arylformamidase
LKKIIDVTLPMTAGLPLWPGTPGLEVTPVAYLETEGYNETRFSSGTHVGTHVDAPSHFLAGGATVDGLPLEVLVGEATVVDLPGVTSITAEVLDRLVLPHGFERLLFKTDNSRFWASGPQDFRQDYVALSSDGADWLAGHGCRLVGIDYLSIQRYQDSNQTHVTLLEAGIIIVEGLNLNEATPGECELICLPLPIVGAEGAPARAILRQ